MPVYTKDFPELLEPGLRAIWGMEDRAWAEEYSQIFEQNDTNKETEKDFGLSGFNLAVQTAEGAPVTYDTVYRTYSKSYTQIKYTLGFIVTREMYEFDQYRQMRQRPKALARSMNETIEVYAAAILNNSFSSATAADAVAICSASHPYKGGTWSNLLSPGADFDVTSLEQMYILIGGFINDRGLTYRAMPQKLICSTSDAFMADQVMKSAQLPGTANNDINPAQNSLPKGKVVSHFVSDTDAWWIQTDAPNGLLFFWSRRKEFTNDSDFDTENAKYKSTMMFVAGCTDPRCIVGSAGG